MIQSEVLIPKKARQVSFDNKALIITDDKGTRYVVSYGRVVLQHKRDAEPEIFGIYSKTSTKHVLEYLYQFCGEDLTPNDLKERIS